MSFNQVLTINAPDPTTYPMMDVNATPETDSDDSQPRELSPDLGCNPTTPTTMDNSVYLYIKSLDERDFNNSPLVNILNMNAEQITNLGIQDLYHISKILEIYYRQAFVGRITSRYPQNVLTSLRDLKSTLLVHEHSYNSKNHRNRDNTFLNDFVRHIIVCTEEGGFKWINGSEVMKFIVHLDALGLIEYKAQITAVYCKSKADDLVRYGFVSRHGKTLPRDH